MKATKGFVQELYRVRRDRNWSMEQMAGACDLSVRYYSDLEKGRHTPKLEKAVAIAKQFEINLEALKEML